MGDEPGLRLREGFAFKVADGPEIASALELRRRVYAEEWPGAPADAVIDELDARASHFIARNSDGTVVASFRLIPPDQRPFDIEHFVKIDNFLPPPRLPAEVGRLCVRHDSRAVRSHSSIHLGLFKLAVDSARALQVTDLLLKAAPRLRNLYRAVGFQLEGITIFHPVYGEEHVMRLDLVAFEARLLRSPTAISRYLLGNQGSKVLG